MKWFKHFSTARNDERISRLEDKTSLEGYGFYFKLLEIVGEAMDETDKHDVTYSLSRWGRQINITSKKFLFLLQCCSDVGLITVQRHSDNINVKIPNLLKFRDNYTKNLQATSKQEVEVEVEVEKKKSNVTKIVKTPGDFDLFWSEYPNKSGRAQALKAWVKIKPNLKTVVDALSWQKESRQWKGGFIPMAATYINNARWEDENPDGSYEDIFAGAINYDK